MSAKHISIAFREHVRTLSNGLKIYKVSLWGGPCHGMLSYCSGDVVYQDGEKYVRGKDNFYHHKPKAGGKS